MIRTPMSWSQGIWQLRRIPDSPRAASRFFSAAVIFAGSPDVNGKFEVKEDGVYRLQVRDLFGGTRSDANNVYRLLVRQAAPELA